MESLLANYASSDDEVHEQVGSRDAGSEEESEEDKRQTQGQQPEYLGSLSSVRSLSSQSLHANLDESQKTPVFRFLPEPKSSSSSSLFFSSLPHPQSNANNSTTHVARRVVQLKPQWYSTSVNGSIIDDDDDDEEGARIAENIVKNSRQFFQTSSVESFLSSIPAPRNTSSLGSTSSGRLETVTRETMPNAPGAVKTLDASKGSQTFTQYDDKNLETQMVDALHSDAYGPVMPKHHHYASYAPDLQNGNHRGCISGNIDGEDRQSISSFDCSVKRSGKRGSSSMVPSEIIEVSQDELMKNRPREDQMRLTGIAFGPSYEATSATEGKPSKLHKRKHQIGSLYYDMKQKEMEFAERRARGLLTKAETQAKYGW